MREPHLMRESKAAGLRNSECHVMATWQLRRRERLEKEAKDIKTVMDMRATELKARAQQLEATSNKVCLTAARTAHATSATAAGPAAAAAADDERCRRCALPCRQGASLEENLKSQKLKTDKMVLARRLHLPLLLGPHTFPISQSGRCASSRRPRAGCRRRRLSSRSRCGAPNPPSTLPSALPYTPVLIVMAAGDEPDEAQRERGAAGPPICPSVPYVASHS